VGDATEKQKETVGRRRPFPGPKAIFSSEEGNGNTRNTISFQELKCCISSDEG
jgi:hypothetical protein